jgi:hypothetical protein
MPMLVGEVREAMAGAGVQITHTDPTLRMVTGTAGGYEMAVGAKPVVVNGKVQGEGAEAVVDILVTVAQVVDYGATRSVVEKVGAILAQQYPGVELVVGTKKAGNSH